MAIVLAAQGFLPAHAQTTAQSGVVISRESRLALELKAALRAEDWKKAAEAGRELVELQPEVAEPAYNLARALARLGERDAAVQWLQKSAERGFFDTCVLVNEWDLDVVRDHPSFSGILERVRRNNAETVELLKPQADKAEIVTILPPGYDSEKPAPMLVALHGLGSSASAFAPIWTKAARDAGAILIAPQAVMRITEIGYDWGVIELAEYIVLQAVEKTRRQYNVDPERIVLAGYSQGAVMAFAIALRNPNVFRGVLPVAGYWDVRYTPIPEKPTALPRFAILNGAGDSAADNNREAARRLESIGVPVLLKIYDGLGHSFPRKDRDAELGKAIEFALGDR
jgi:phospholipase/carboxylesterase